MATMGTSDTNSVLKTSRKAMYISLRPQAVTCMAVANPNTQRPYNLISTYKLETCPPFSPLTDTSLCTHHAL